MRLIPEPLQVQLLWLFWEQDFSIAWLRASHFLGLGSAETQKQAETKSHLGLMHDEVKEAMNYYPCPRRN